MKELIKITTNEQGQKLVSGRELHEVLEIKTPFKQWMDRMIAYGFQENADFTTINIFVQRENSNLGNNKTDYILTLDMAKHIAMVQRTEIGMRVRNYFLECEKIALQQTTPSYMIADPIERAKRWIVEQEERMALEQQKQQLLIETQSQQKEIEHQKQVILGLTQDSPKPELRQRINQIIRFGARGGYQGRYGLAYKEFDMAYHMNVELRLKRAIERGEVKSNTNRMDFICGHLDMTWQLYQVVARVFEGDLRAISQSIVRATERTQ